MNQPEQWDFVYAHIKTFPHCDHLVLHAPGKCEYCDRLPVLQAYRIAMGIAFSGEDSDELIPCPSELRRDREVINRWPGNRASR